MKTRSSRFGFNLIEIVLALGIIAVAVIPLMGLLSFSFTSNRQSGDDSMVPAMATQIISELRARTFNDKVEETEQFYAFDASGTLLKPEDVSLATFLCKVKSTPDPNYESKEVKPTGTPSAVPTPTPSPTPVTNLRKLKLVFFNLKELGPGDWASKKLDEMDQKKAKKVIHASIARY